MPEGQRLRWWEEEQSATPAAYRSVPPSTPPVLSQAEAAASDPLAETYRDIGEELEAEARRRAGIARPQEQEVTVTFFSETSRVVRSLSACRRRVWTAIAFAGVCLALQLTVLLGNDGISRVSPARLGAMAGMLCYLVFAILLLRQLRRAAQPQAEPVLTVSPGGIAFRSACMDTGVIAWRDITGLRTDRLSKRAPADLIIQLRDESVKRQFRYGSGYGSRADKRVEIRLGRLPLATIEETNFLRVPAYLLPVDAEIVMVRIAAYEAAR